MDALLIVDLQNDFCPGGALPTLAGDRVVPVVNRLAARFDVVVQTQDWHPLGHVSFASTHGRQPFETLQTAYGEQTLWPDHCVPGTRGAEFHPDLDTRPTQLVVRKGFHLGIDSYSAFRENDRETTTGLAGYLRERGVDHLVVCGLATDYCVKWSALDARAAGLQVTVVTDAVSPVAEETEAVAWTELSEAGVRIAASEEL